MDRREQADLDARWELFRCLTLRLQSSGIRFMLADPLRVTIHRRAGRGGDRCFLRFNLRLSVAPNSKIARKPAKLAHYFLAERPVLFGPPWDLKTAPALPARFFGGAQDRFLVLDLGL